jgi:hypothetical protein
MLGEPVVTKEPMNSESAPVRINSLKPWVEPSLAKIEAGAAETGTLYGADSTIHTS